MITSIDQIKTLPDSFYRENLPDYPPSMLRPLFVDYVRTALDEGRERSLNGGYSHIKDFQNALNNTVRKKYVNPTCAAVEKELREYAKKNKIKYVRSGYIGPEEFDPAKHTEVGREIAGFFRKVDKAHKAGIPALLAFQKSLGGNLITKDQDGKTLLEPIKKANGKTIPPANNEPITRPVVTGLPVIKEKPAVIIKNDIIMVSFKRFPGWNTVKWFRENQWKWNPRKYYHEKPLTAESLNKITDLIGG